MNNADVCRVTDNDDEGVDDILKLRDFSEMSLIHTLRVRYFRGAIYTFVGPILVSINPYKYIKGIYSEKTMVSYHVTDKNAHLAPHLFSVAESSYSALLNRKTVYLFDSIYASHCATSVLYSQFHPQDTCSYV